MPSRACYLEGVESWLDALDKEKLTVLAKIPFA